MPGSVNYKYSVLGLCHTSTAFPLPFSQHIPVAVLDPLLPDDLGYHSDGPGRKRLCSFMSS